MSAKSKSKTKSPTSPPPTPAGNPPAAGVRQKSAAAGRAKSAELREIGPLPVPANPTMRRKAELDPEFFEGLRPSLKL